MELLKLVVNGRSHVQIPPSLPVRHGSGCVDAPRGVVVAGLDPWTPLTQVPTGPELLILLVTQKKTDHDNKKNRGSYK